MLNFKETKNKSALSTRWAQMTKQEQIIERKKMEIQAKLEAQKQAAALAAQAKLSNFSNDDKSGNIFSNDGSFMSQYKALLEKQKQDKEKKEQTEKIELEAKLKKNESMPKSFDALNKSNNEDIKEQFSQESKERFTRDQPKKWNSKGRNDHANLSTSIVEDQKNVLENSNVSILKQMPAIPIDNCQSTGSSCGGLNSVITIKQEDNIKLDPDIGVSGNGGPLEQRISVSNSLGHGSKGPGPTVSATMGSTPLRPAPKGLSPIDSNMDAMTPGPMGTMNIGPNLPCRLNSGPIQNMGPGPAHIMRPSASNMPPNAPFFGRPPSCPMPPNFMGPNGPRGPCGPGPLPPNMCNANMHGPGPNGPIPPFFGPPFSNPGMMGPNGPPNTMMPFMASPPFGPNGPRFRPNGPFGPNGPPNRPFMPNNSMPNNLFQTIPESQTLEAISIPPPEPMKLQNIPPPTPLPLNHIPKQNDLDPENVPAPCNTQVLSADMMPPPVQRAAAEVASNGDHWENVLKAIHSHDQNMWFLHNTDSNEYKAFRDLVTKMRNDGVGESKADVKPEDKYEPEFCLEDDDSYDESRPVKQEAYDSDAKYDDDDSENGKDSKLSKRDRKRKSRWGENPPADVKPPGVATPLAPVIPGTKLAKIDEGGIKLTNLNRNNPALMQYAMTNYGTTNLSVEDWKKCEDNFKLNLLYQDMLKKRQEVDRLAAAGKHKYEYDSDEDISEGTWEHRLRAKEMCATEKWADELTKQAAGKHHIGDFLPPEELRKFMEKYSAIKSGKEPDLSDYKEFKLKEDNLGFKMLQKLGWSEGQGLGAEGSGIVEPINKAHQPVANLGLGASNSDVVSSEDDEFDAYRKRMMLAYRFRPNPLRADVDDGIAPTASLNATSLDK